jgi:hypothetical protein
MVTWIDFSNRITTANKRYWFAVYYKKECNDYSYFDIIAAIFSFREQNYHKGFDS